MKFYDVYPMYDIEPVKGLGSKLYDNKGTEYYDFFGGNGVISIGHSHPYFIEKITKQIENLLFYSNSFRSSLKDEFADLLGKISGYEDYDLFLVNSGAEAVENALKVASFYNGRSKALTLSKAFHGRTTAAIAVTDNQLMRAPINNSVNAKFLEINDTERLLEEVSTKEYCAVIVEGIQGAGGIHLPEESYLKAIREICDGTNTVFVIDEIQSGNGRTGEYFAHKHFNVAPDIITIAKGIANGIPAGGVLISGKFEPKHGILGSTFGGNQLACAGGIAVLEIMKKERLIENARDTGKYFLKRLRENTNIKEVRGKGLMVGLEFDYSVDKIRKRLMNEFRIFTGSSYKNIIRLLPPLCITRSDIDYFIDSLVKVI